MVTLLTWLLKGVEGVGILRVEHGAPPVPPGFEGGVGGDWIGGPGRGVKRVRLNRKTPAHLVRHGILGIQSLPRVWKRLGFRIFPVGVMLMPRQGVCIRMTRLMFLRRTGRGLSEAIWACAGPRLQAVHVFLISFAALHAYVEWTYTPVHSPKQHQHQQPTPTPTPTHHNTTTKDSEGNLWSFHRVQFLDKVYTRVVAVWCRWPDSAEHCGDAAVAVFEQGDGRPCDLAATSSGVGNFWRPRRLTAVSRRGLGVALTPGVELPGVRPLVVA